MPQVRNQKREKKKNLSTIKLICIYKKVSASRWDEKNAETATAPLLFSSYLDFFIDMQPTSTT